jgi:hypothetical protein
MSTATQMRDLYIAAEKAVLRGQSFSMGGRTLTMADLEKIRAGRKEWEARVADEASGRQGPLRYSVGHFGC